MAAFDSTAGGEVARGQKGHSDVYLDAGTGGFYYIDRDDYIATHDARGELLHLLGARLLEQYDRLAIWREADAYLIASRSWGNPPRGKGYLWAVEKVRLGDTSKMDDQKVLKDRKREGLVSQRVETLVRPPRDGNVAVLATRDRFYLMDDRLKVTEAITGEFVPLSVSLDDAGRIHALVRSGEQGRFWILTKAGERLLDMPVPLPPDTFPPPPVIGRSGRVYLLLPGEVVAVEFGRVAWREPVDAAPVATVGGDGRLVAAVGASVIGFDLLRNRTVLASFPGEELRTPPVLDAHGRLYVASERRLYCLSATR